MKPIRKDSSTIIIRNECLEKYLRDIKNNKGLAQEEYEVLKLAKAGDQAARDKLIKANLKFVVTVAKEFQVRGFDINDLISAGNIGLIEAIDKFSLDNKVKFISYAVWWIRNGIIEEIKENKNVIRLPFNKQQEIQDFNKQREKFEQQTQSNLTAEQVAQLSNVELGDDAKRALFCSNATASLDYPLSDTEEDSLSDILPGDQEDFTMFDQKEHNKFLLNKAILELTATQQKVLALSFGLEDQIFRSNEDIAEALGLTAERVRQVKQNGLKKLKTIPYLKMAL